MSDPVLARAAGRNALVLDPGPLAANATYYQPWQDTLTGFAGQVGGRVYSDQPGTLAVEVSDDMVDADQVLAVPVAANQLAVAPLTPVPARYFRFRYSNGGTAQTTFRLRQTQSAVGAPQPGQASGSIAQTVTIAQGTGTVPRSLEAPGLGYATHDPASGTYNLTAGQAETITFSGTAAQTMVWNLGSGPVYLAFDGETANGTGSNLMLPAGAMVELSLAMTALHVYSASAGQVQVQAFWG